MEMRSHAMHMIIGSDNVNSVRIVFDRYYWCRFRLVTLVVVAIAVVPMMIVIRMFKRASNFSSHVTADFAIG